MKLTLKQRIELGVAFVKGVFGPDALERINLQRLALNNGKACILGQLDGDYSSALIKFGMSREMAYNHGFIVGSGLSSSKEDRAFDALDRAWKIRIAKEV